MAIVESLNFLMKIQKAYNAYLEVNPNGVFLLQFVEQVFPSKVEEFKNARKHVKEYYG